MIFFIIFIVSGTIALIAANMTLHGLFWTFLIISIFSASAIIISINESYNKTSSLIDERNRILEYKSVSHDPELHEFYNEEFTTRASHFNNELRHIKNVIRGNITFTLYFPPALNKNILFIPEIRISK